MRKLGLALVVCCSLLALSSCCEEDNPVTPVYLEQVADLRVAETDVDSITLEWTAPLAQGEDVFYDIRYLDAASMGGESQISEGLWAVADTVDGEPVPSHAGYVESYVIGGLAGDVEYFAAIRVVRASDGEMSDISNTASTTTDVVYVECRYPSLAIPDDNGAGIYDVLAFPHQVEISEIQVEINITHTYIGDLIVELTSPTGTVVRLHSMGGGGADNIIGTYGVNLTESGPGSLDDFMGELSQGNWTLWVSDNLYFDLGTLNAWCVIARGHTP